MQWESNRQLQFKVPRRVVEFLSEEYARLEGNPSGVLISELTVVEKPASEVNKLPEQKPFIQPPRVLREVAGMRQEVFSMSEGSVSIEWPAALSKESFEDFKDWLKILERKVGRSVETAKPLENGSESQEPS